MRRTPDFNEQERELGQPRTLDDREPTDREHAAAAADEPIGVAHRRSRAPTREQDEEDVAEEDIMDAFDDDEVTAVR